MCCRTRREAARDRYRDGAGAGRHLCCEALHDPFDAAVVVALRLEIHVGHGELAQRKPVILLLNAPELCDSERSYGQQHDRDGDLPGNQVAPSAPTRGRAGRTVADQGHPHVATRRLKCGAESRDDESERGRQGGDDQRMHVKAR